MAALTATSILADILSIASMAVPLVGDVNTVVGIVEKAIAAFKSGSQADLDAAHASAVALANSLAPGT